jgi:hypothetical protein
MTRRTIISAWILGGLFALVFITVLVAPSQEQGRSFSTYSRGADGVRLGRDLIERLGWRPEAREAPFSDTLSDPAPIQVLVSADVSASEAGDLLAFVRRGGSLLVAGPRGAFRDSLLLEAREPGVPVEAALSPHCDRRGSWRTELTQLTEADAISWRGPLPVDTVGFGSIRIDRGPREPGRVERAAIGMRLGAGRLVVVADPSILVNDMLRRCELETDVALVRMMEYLSRDTRGQRVAFDEYHHGYGVRGGSIAAIRMYLSGTPSGRMLAQMAVAGLLLLFAFAPRPLVPRDPTHVARRSPLEHADALAHAYAGVNATRTATARLLAGVRRRTRAHRGRAGDSDEAILVAAAALSAAGAAASSVVSNALQRTVPERELPAVAAAIDTIERELTQRITSPAR